MTYADDHAVTSTGHVFQYQQDAVGQRFSKVNQQLAQRVSALTDDEALGLEPLEWGMRAAEGLAVRPPRPAVNEHEFIQEGAVEVDCTHWSGVTYSLSEAGRVMRPGFRFRVTVPGCGDLTLLQTRLSAGGLGQRADVTEDAITRHYSWPQVLQAGHLQEDVDRFLRALEVGAEELAGRIATENGQLPERAAELLLRRQEEIRNARAYLGGLRLTVTRDARADTSIVSLPRRMPAAGTPRGSRVGASDVRRPEGASVRTMAGAVTGPTLEQFYDHVVSVIGATAVGFERTPRRFADAQEEALRDFILVTLNSHYEGAVTGETFNGSGKTDILVRHGMDNAFIGECKIWGGSALLTKTFEQLLGYTTWRDNRLALIFFVRNKKLEPVIVAVREFLAARPEFGRWETGEVPEGQLRCSLRWEDAARKEGRLAVFFVHLPPD